MLRSSRLLVTAWLCVVLAGCWAQPDYDAGRTRWNALERSLTRENVDGLGVQWRAALDEGAVPRWVDAAAVGGAVYVVGGPGKVSRLDAGTGDVVWTRTLDPGEAPTPPYLSSPIFFRDALRVNWSCCRAGVGGSFWLDPATGAEIDGPPDGVGFATAIAGGALAGISPSDGHSPTGLSWGDVRLSDMAGERGSSASTFAIVGDSVQWAYGTLARGFTGPCRPTSDPDFGCEPDWVTDLGAEPAGPVAVGPDAVAYPHSRVYPDVGNAVTVLDVATGAVRWRADFAGSIGAPVVAGGVLLVPTAGGVAALPAAGCGAPSCAPLWTVDLAGPAALPAGGDVVYAAVAGGPVVAMALGGCGAPTCSPLASVDVGGAAGDPIVARGRVIVANAARELVALGPPD